MALPVRNYARYGKAYRPALGGRTARGLGVPPPRINLRNREQFESPTEAMVLTSLASGDQVGPGFGIPISTNSLCTLAQKVMVQPLAATYSTPLPLLGS